MILHVATHAEDPGYAAVFVAEGWGHDVAVLLAGIAGRTSRIGLGSGVPNVWGRSPATIVMTAAGLDDLDHVLETLRPGGEPVP